jgi:hypothetical protein
MSLKKEYQRIDRNDRKLRFLSVSILLTNFDSQRYAKGYLLMNEYHADTGNNAKPCITSELERFWPQHISESLHCKITVSASSCPLFRPEIGMAD